MKEVAALSLFALRRYSHERSDLTNVDHCVLRGEAETGWPQAVSAGADAGASLPVQFGLCWLRQDTVPSARAEAAAYARGLFPGC